jgi:AbrB family looped-hinge helix DNA binding protein
MLATITSKGQVTIPKPIRERLHLRSGDQIDFAVDVSGAVRVLPKTLKARDVYGMLKRKGRKPLTIEQMEEKAAKAMAREWR